MQYNWYPDMAFDGGKSEGGTLDKGWVLGDVGAFESKNVPSLMLYGPKKLTT